MSGDNSRASWVSITPVKQNRDPICSYQQENQTTQPCNFVPGQVCKETELPESSQVSHVLHGTGFPELSAHSSLTNPVKATTELSGTTFSMDCVDKNIPFCDLLALANAAAKTALGSNDVIGSIPVTRFEEGNETNQLGKEKQFDNNMGVVQQTEQSSDAISSQVLEKNNSGPGGNVSLGRSTPAQQKPRRKRYMPKVVREGQPKRTPKPTTPKPVKPNDTPKPKRKYVRKKGTSIPQNPLFVDLTETDEETPINLTNTTRNFYPDTPSVNLDSSKSETAGRPQRSCRRSLNFDSLQEEEESSPYSNASGFQSQISYAKFQSQLGQGPDVSAVKGQLDQIADVQSWSTRAKCRIVFSDVTHDKESNVIQMIDLNSPPASSSPNDSNCSTSTPLSKEEHARRMKRGHPSPADDLYNTNIVGARQNSVQAYLAKFPVDQDIDDGIPGMHFPAIYKKKRTEKCQNVIDQTTGYSPKVNWGGAFTPESFAAQCAKPLITGTMMDTGNKGTRKKRSKASTRVRDIASLIEIAESIQSTRLSIQQVGTSRQSYCHTAKTTKKRTKRNHRASGAFPVDALVEHLRHLDINAERKQVAYPNVWARSYNTAQYQEQNAIVVYQRDGTLVTVKKRKSRPRVDLDDETTRVWKLLLQDINSEGINGTDEEKEKWWEEERRIFDGRANSFIKCMHLIQGDRTFSRWKGSVVDSVVGVFLTQNVSDHLSSSAYMSLAAQFPLVEKSNHNPLSEDVVNITVNDLEACILNPDDTIEWHGIKSKPPTLTQKSTILEDVESNEDIEVVNSNESSVSSMCCIIPKDISSCNCSDIAGTTSFVELLHMTEQNKYNGTAISGIHWEGKEVFCSSESGLSRENASHSVVHHMVEIQSKEVQSCTRNDFPDCSIQTELDIVCHPQTSSSDLKNEVKSSDQDQVERINYTEGPRTLEETGGTGTSDISTKNEQESSLEKHNSLSPTITDGKTYKPKRGRKGKQPAVKWDSLRKQAQVNGERVRTPDTSDSVDWEAVRRADVEEVAHTIRERGMNNMLAERIKAFLDRLVSDHGSINLEWLRDVPPDKAKEYLLSIRGLGLKSVECVRLLTLHHIAFPVDTNVGRIAVRLGWVPLQPLPESLQLHLLELYPVLESIQKYLWPRLCKLDQRTLYELHYQMITFGKVFCTKSKPNCNACPLRGECRHFASAFASARLALPGPEERSIVASGYNVVNPNPVVNINRLQLPASQSDQLSEKNMQISHCEPIVEVPASPEPIIEVPATPEPERAEGGEDDIEDLFDEDPDEIPTIKLDIQEFTQTLQEYIHRNMELQECDVSKALVALTPEAASIPAVKLKNVSRLRTEHQVYELPDTHPLLDGLDRREPDDPCSYLLAIWTPGETADSIQPPAGPCNNQESGGLCSDETCFACSSTREAQSQTVRGTILIPCRTAMRGSFPLNGTYFQVNEVFADHASSINPLNIPRYLLWNLPRKTVYFGTSVTSIFRGMETKDIQFCFWRGFVCVRGFDRESRSPRPLMARLHFPPSKLSRGKEKKESE
ncbi:hypothetical protein DCAR_0520207 [Daucus carota subsp. sativus]|uniref:HhH-GPD domain-containing protein n=1 Tax=Daucus carota subsp. sativus TaxID=79200 RepID=A0AAF1B1V7_DAUCS|nr:hypothetical protein DCAR_0520207 [Daucus carota subsp. sativus]